MVFCNKCYTAHEPNNHVCSRRASHAPMSSNTTVHNLQTCPYCHTVFSTLHWLENHLFYSHNDQCLPCRNCKKGFLHQSDYVAHMYNCQQYKPSKTHSVEKPASPVFEKHTCPHCDKVLATLDYLRRHLFYGHSAISIICSSCKIGFFDQDDYVAHNDKCQDYRPLKIISVEKPVEKPVEKTMEKTVEKTVEKPASPVLEKHTCPHCDKVLAMLDYLQIHLFYNHKAISHICSHCQKGFLNQDDYTTHTYHCQKEPFKRKKTHSTEKPSPPVFKRHTCPHCDKVFAALHYLEKHLFHVHKAKSHLCRSSEKGVVHQVSNGAHMGKCHSSSISSEKKLMCPHCLREFKNLFALNAHLQGCCIQFECLCGKDFLKLTDLEDHIVSCQRTEISCLCFYCGQRFPNSKSRQRHECPKREEKRHLCPLCRKGFNDLHNLKGHLNAHKGERPHVCPHCNKHYRELSELENHMYVHGDVHE